VTTKYDNSTGDLTMTPHNSKYGTATGHVNADGSDLKLQLSGVGKCTGAWNDGTQSVDLTCVSDLVSTIKCDVSFHCDSGDCTEK